MRLAGAAVMALVASCNAILGNGNFRGPGDAEPGDAPVADACSGIGCQVVDCAKQGKPPTSVSGTVYTPSGQLPLRNALVYIPTEPLDPLGDGPTSPACASGTPAMFATTDVSGHFKLDNVPSVANLPLVIQVGKWRRQVTIPAVNECADLPLAASDTRLPQNSSEGHLPRIAININAPESLECVMLGLGVAEREFTGGTGGGRIHLYAGPGSPTTRIGPDPIEDVDMLYGRMAQYDMLLFGCDGLRTDRSQQTLQMLLDYTTGGGWVWLSHFHSNWLAPPTPFPSFAAFDFANTVLVSPNAATIDTSSTGGQVFADWMTRVGASQQPGQVTIDEGHSTCVSVDSNIAQRLLYFDPATANGATGVQLLSWSPRDRGRFVYSDLHVLRPSTASATFPVECGNPRAAITPKGMAMAYLLFDQPTCTP